MEQFLENIKKDFLSSFLHIPSTMARVFGKKILEQLKISEENAVDQQEKEELIEESFDSIISSSSENENESTENIKEKIKSKIKEKKVIIDLFNGKTAEHLLTFYTHIFSHNRHPITYDQ